MAVSLFFRRRGSDCLVEDQLIRICLCLHETFILRYTARPALRPLLERIKRNKSLYRTSDQHMYSSEHSPFTIYALDIGYTCRNPVQPFKSSLSTVSSLAVYSNTAATPVVGSIMAHSDSSQAISSESFVINAKAILHCAQCEHGSKNEKKMAALFQ
jgi:hypothetical protein